MRTGTKVLTVFLGYLAAVGIASAVVGVRIALTSGPDRNAYVE